MANIILRDAQVDVKQEDIEMAVRVSLGAAVANLATDWLGSRVSVTRPVRPKITIDGVEDLDADWEVGRIMVGEQGAMELLFARQLLNERGGDIGSDFILVILGNPESVATGAIQKVAHVDHEDDGMLYCFGGPDKQWEEEWDQALVLLREHRYRFQ